MKDPFPTPDRALDKAVRAHLDVEANLADTGRLLDGVDQRLAGDTIDPVRRRRRWWVAAAGALAATILIVGFLLFSGGIVAASPRHVVERARSVHQAPVDRCYAVRVEIPSEVRKLFPRVDLERESRLWTRGDRYFVELPNGHSYWGRDETKRVWFVPTPDAGVRFDENEVPNIFREFLNIRAVNLPEMLDEVLAECDLTWANNVDVPSDVRRVYAVGRDPARSLRGAVIDVERESSVVRRLSLDRQVFRDPRAKVSVTFTLVDTTPQDVQQYSPEGHLKAGAPIFDGAHPALRLGLVVRHLGELKKD